MGLFFCLAFPNEGGENVTKQDAVLMLEDGRLFRGTALGATGEATGEVCFNTGMSGYQEILTHG